MQQLAISSPVSADAWSGALQRVLSQPQRIRVEYQPIVDLRRASVCGYEALARFPDAPEVSPRAWFEAAATLGCIGALEAQVVQAALVAQPLLVRDRFIAVNVSPAALLSDEVQAVLGAEHSLSHVVVELTDRIDTRALLDAADALRAAGAGIAVHGIDADAALSPRYVKVPTVELLARPLHATPGAAIVAERIETQDELDALVAMGVPFGQGFALGRPAPALAELRREVRGRIQRRERSEHAATLAAILEPAPAGLPPAAALCLELGTPLRDAARRAMARSPETRFDPIVVVDADGTLLAVVSMERLVGALAR